MKYFDACLDSAVGAQPDRFIRSVSELTNAEKHWLEPLNAFEKFFQALLYAVIKIVIFILFRPKVHGLDNLPQGIPLVFTPNHASYIDAFLLAAILPFSRLQTLHWVGWAGIAFKNTLCRTLSRLLLGIPIEPNRGVRSSMSLSAAALELGHSMVWFPEGERTLNGELLPFREGIGVLLARFPGMHVVPVYLKDTAKALAPGRWTIRPIRLEVFIGNPVLVSKLLAEGRGEKPRKRIVSALRDSVLQLDPNKSRNCHVD